MEIKPNQHDAAIDKTLAAFKNAAPPQGLEARIAARLQQQPAPTPSWRDRITGYTLPAAWWRGAATGAAFALLAVAAVVLLHPSHKTPHTQTAIAIAAPAPAPAAATPVNTAASSNPCVQPAILRVHAPAPALETASRSDSPAGGSSHPVASSPLTTQERELLRLAQTADPKVLATFNSEHQAQLEAENAAQFEKFFAPPPRPPAPPDQPAANPEASPQANPEITPPAAPEPSSAVHN